MNSFEKGNINEFANRKDKLALIFTLSFILILVLFTSIFNFYPGGYAIKEIEDGIVVEKGVFHNEVYTIPETKENTIQIALLIVNIKQLKTMWYVSILSIAAILISSITFLTRFKSKSILTILTTILIVIVTLLSFRYLENLDYIDGLIFTLRGK